MHLDIALNMMRHLTRASTDGFLDELDSELAALLSNPSPERLTAVAGGSNHSAGEGSRMVVEADGPVGPTEDSTDVGTVMKASVDLNMPLPFSQIPTATTPDLDPDFVEDESPMQNSEDKAALLPLHTCYSRGKRDATSMDSDAQSAWMQWKARRMHMLETIQANHVVFLKKLSDLKNKPESAAEYEILKTNLEACMRLQSTLEVKDEDELYERFLLDAG